MDEPTHENITFQFWSGHDDKCMNMCVLYFIHDTERFCELPLMHEIMS